MGATPFHGIFRSFQNRPEQLQVPAPPHGRMVSDRNEQRGRLALDIYEKDDYTIIRAPIAGVRLSDLDIEVTDDVITIRGERRQSEQIAPDQFYLQECYYGPFSRSVTLPAPIDPRKVRATFSKDCVLKILIPKEERVKIVRITEA